ncbi:redoxin domain-containing protein [Bradyrhizobium sp. AUGA SZCCT0431]|uniref:redoxin domain-containing protein n=1 Tax=Bradyrhizobium sp. AUGA SZCCT0431 TaxID=2807674 RepID=UPI001BA706E5|nr:redoxin domain-containing protein [Bradyrhizobium sp. AUGA SZCCT0431]MBR1143409.1 redoxin domain-containing protein [Bradyrhizobium sp. AUGA SZCCT0431]
MSKKTRKKSSKGSAKTPAKTPAKSSAKTPAKKSARKTIPAKAARSGSKAPVKTPAAKAGKAVATKSGKAAKSALTKESHKPASKSLKSNLSAAPKSDSGPIPKPTEKPLPAPGPAAALAEGAKAPSFRLPRDGGNSVALADYAGRKLVLFFYPRADTPGCTREAIDFTRLKDAFAESGTAVLGISADTVRAQESFRDKHQLSIPLISDEKHEMLEAYGAWGEKSMYGRTFLGILRTTILIGKDGKIAKIWRNVRVDGHADEVLAAVQGL